MGRSIIEGENPVGELVMYGRGFLSRGEPEKFPLNRPAPSGKAKYVQKTDSAEYREGKVKRTGNTGVKRT